ncbi:hypothetical protein TNCV_1600951 [Trichonephila clavipes]|nr:hypothetical protein TNCV_1600951 [Trichonephila clavipes]
MFKLLVSGNASGDDTFLYWSRHVRLGKGPVTLLANLNVTMIIGYDTIEDYSADNVVKSRHLKSRYKLNTSSAKRSEMVEGTKGISEETVVRLIVDNKAVGAVQI